MKKLVLLLSIALTTTIVFSQCDEIKTEKDKFTDVITYRSPSLNQIVVMSTVTEQDTSVYLYIRGTGRTARTGEPVILLLENGEKIVKNARTKVRVKSAMNSEYEHSALFKLTPDEVELLNQYVITDVRLFLTDVKIINPEKYKGYINCISNQ
jgi:hypothetical protein